MQILLFLFYLISLFVVPVTVYIGAVSLFALKKKALPGNAPILQWMTVIPAHNEELHVGRTVDSLRKARPDATVIVLADNCSDQTEAEASRAGALTTARHDPTNPGKGQALDWFFKTHSTHLKTHEAVAIVDADSLVNESFFSGLESVLAIPEILVGQAFYDVAPPLDGWRKKLTSIALRAFHHVRPAGRRNLGGSAGLRGNGMAFRPEILRRYGWPAHSNVEDLEFSLMLCLDGIGVAYAPDAMVLGEMPGKREAATAQRMRWEGGRLAVARQWLPRLVRSWRRRPTMLVADAAFDLATPPLSLLVMIQLGFAGLGFLLSTQWGMIALLPLGVTALHVVLGLVLTRAPMSLWTALCFLPFFLGWKISLYAILAVSRHVGWNRTQR